MLKSIFLFILIALPGFASADPVVVHVGISDGLAFDRKYIDMVSEFLAEKLPGHRIENVVVKGDGPKRSMENVRDEIAAGLAKIPIAPGDVITHLVIETHGDTVVEGEKVMTVLHGLGKVAMDGVTPEFDSIFAPLKGRLDPAATVVLNSCSTMCGPEGESASRSKAFLEYFGATDGSLYGATVSEMQIANGYKDEFNWREWITLRKTLVLSLPLAGAFASASHLVTGDGSLVTNLAGLSLLALPFADRLGTWVGIVNRGKIFRFTGGRVDSIEDVDRLNDRDSIYGVASRASLRCEALFVGNRH